MENPIKMDDLGVPLFLETTIYNTMICKFCACISFSKGPSSFRFYLSFSGVKTTVSQNSKNGAEAAHHKET